MVDIVVSVAAKVAEYMVAPIRRQCGYVIFTDRYVGQLKEKLDKLENAMQRVQHSVDEALRNGKLIEDDVKEWVKNVETITNKPRYDGRAKKTCFYRWLPNLKERYRLNRDARKTIQAITTLILEGKFEKVFHEGPPPGQVVGASDVNSSNNDGVNTITDSRAPIFQAIMEALNDEKLKVIGVYGAGGVGKTTLLEEVRKKLKKAGTGRPFHMIVKSEVSQNPVLKNIQDDIAYFLGLDLSNVSSVEGRKDILFKRLQENTSEKVLIILDDLWQELDLEAVGIPLRDVSGKCKLLLTSRDGKVLLADRKFCLEGLENDEALRLFEKEVGDRLKEDEELKAIAVKVVKKLAGLPLLINSVASTLKDSDAPAWRNALKKIDASKIETIVKLSYDHLKTQDAKSLFLLCGLIGGTIKVETLLVLGMGLGLFEGFNETMQDSRDRLNEMLDSLRFICLLQYGGDDKDNVTIHDLYSEVVVSTPLRGQNSLMTNSNYGLWPREKREKCWAIWLTDIGRDRLAEPMAWQFPNLEILMLSSLGSWHRQCDMGDCSGLPDFTYMGELRVLDLPHITSLPSSIGILGNLRSLCLNYCWADVAILGKLKALQILSLAWSSISRLPKEIGELTNLRLLNLSHCYSLKKVEPGALKGLIKLEELYMMGSFDRWMGEDEIPSESCNARLAELKSLTKLTALEISIPNPTVLFKDGDLPFGNLIRFWINIGNVQGRRFEGLNTMKLKLEGCDSILSREWVQKILQKTQHLHLEGLRESKNNVHELCTEGFGQLKHLDILNSPSIKYIVNSSEGAPIQVTFPDITTLSIGGLRFKEIWNNHVPIDSFCKLESLKLKHCDNLLRIAPSHMWKRLQHSLEILEVESCRSIEIIYEGDGTVTKDGKLRRLVLRDLANLRHIWQSDGLPNVPFPNLRSVEVERCSGLKMLFATFTEEFLGQIEYLEVESCENMELIAGDAECEEAIGRTITFSKLTALRLFKLPKFRSFLPEKYSLKFPYSEDFPSLRILSIVSCGTEENRGGNIGWQIQRILRVEG